MMMLFKHLQKKPKSLKIYGFGILFGSLFEWLVFLGTPYQIIAEEKYFRSPLRTSPLESDSCRLMGEPRIQL